MLLTVSTGGSVFLENPPTSWTFRMKVFAEFVKCLRRGGRKAACPLRLSCRLLFFFRMPHLITEAYKVSFWMRHHGHENPKRTTVISDRKVCSRLDRGKLKMVRSVYPTARHYFDKNGRRRFVGISGNLKKSGCHAYKSIPHVQSR